MPASIEIQIVVPSDAIPRLVVNEYGAGTEIVYRSRHKSLANEKRAPLVELRRVIERNDLRCSVMQVVIRNGRAALVDGNVHALMLRLPIDGVEQNCESMFRQEITNGSNSPVERGYTRDTQRIELERVRVGLDDLFL